MALLQQPQQHQQLRLPLGPERAPPLVLLAVQQRERRQVPGLVPQEVQPQARQQALLSLA